MEWMWTFSLSFVYLSFLPFQRICFFKDIYFWKIRACNFCIFFFINFLVVLIQYLCFMLKSRHQCKGKVVCNRSDRGRYSPRAWSRDWWGIWQKATCPLPRPPSRWWRGSLRTWRAMRHLPWAPWIEEPEEPGAELTVLIRQVDGPPHLPDGASKRRLDRLTHLYTDLLDQLAGRAVTLENCRASVESSLNIAAKRNHWESSNQIIIVIIQVSSHPGCRGRLCCLWRCPGFPCVLLLRWLLTVLLWRGGSLGEQQAHCLAKAACMGGGPSKEKRGISCQIIPF